MSINKFLKIAFKLEKLGLYKEADNIDSLIKISQLDLLGPSRGTNAPQMGGGGMFNPFAAGGQVSLTTGFSPAGYKGKGSNTFMAFTQYSPEQIAAMNPAQRMQLVAAQGRAIADQIAKQVQKTGFTNITNLLNGLDTAFAQEPYKSNENAKRELFKENFSSAVTQFFKNLVLLENNYEQIYGFRNSVISRYNLDEVTKAVDNGIIDAIKSINPGISKYDTPENRTKYFAIEKSSLNSLIPEEIKNSTKNIPRPAV